MSSATHSRTPFRFVPMLRASLAIAWASVLWILGAVTLLDGPGPLPLPNEAFILLGVAAIAAGQFVFAVLVADRWFPRAHRGLIARAEALMLLTFVLGLVMAGYVVWLGY